MWCGYAGTHTSVGGAYRAWGRIPSPASVPGQLPHLCPTCLSSLFPSRAAMARPVGSVQGTRGVDLRCHLQWSFLLWVWVRVKVGSAQGASEAAVANLTFLDGSRCLLPRPADWRPLARPTLPGLSGSPARN